MATRTITRYRTRTVRARRRSRAGFTIPLAVVAGFAPTALYAWDRFKVGDYDNGVRRILGRLTGWDSWQNVWRWQDFVSGMGPVLGGLLIHRMANKFGVNRTLKNAGIPWIRI